MLASPAGLRLGGAGRLSPYFDALVFADVRYEFYFAEGATTKVIPVRMGVVTP